jgi:tetratricopeptide (TPR) repeat protein
VIERLLAAQAALDRGDLEVAHGLFAQVAGADPRNAIAVVGLARVAQRRGAPDEAGALARRALEIDNDEAAAWRLLGELADELEAGELEARAAAASAPVPARQRAKRRSRWRRIVDRFLRRG